jgi:hypothetical protein
MGVDFNVFIEYSENKETTPPIKTGIRKKSRKIENNDFKNGLGPDCFYFFPLVVEPSRVQAIHRYDFLSILEKNLRDRACFPTPESRSLSSFTRYLLPHSFRRMHCLTLAEWKNACEEFVSYCREQEPNSNDFKIARMPENCLGLLHIAETLAAEGPLAALGQTFPNPTQHRANALAECQAKIPDQLMVTCDYIKGAYVTTEMPRSILEEAVDALCASYWLTGEPFKVRLLDALTSSPLLPELCTIVGSYLRTEWQVRIFVIDDSQFGEWNTAQCIRAVDGPCLYFKRC